jgi:hypothetical protein
MSDHIIDPGTTEQIANVHAHVWFHLDLQLQKHSGKKRELLDSVSEISTVIPGAHPGHIAQRELRKFFMDWGGYEVVFEESRKGCRIRLLGHMPAPL